MRAIEFPQANRLWQAPKGMENCDDLHCYQDSESIISCWKMTWKERISALIFGKVWHWHYTQRPNPVAMLVSRTVFEKPND